MYALPKYILALPLFFAAQKTQQHQIYFCVHFTVSNLTNTFFKVLNPFFVHSFFATQAKKFLFYLIFFVIK